MITAGETWLSYMGVPDDYPDFLKLAFEINDAMWDAAAEVLHERMADDVVLRALHDDRYRLHELVDGVPVGVLPPGVEIIYRDEHHIAKGVTRAPHESPHPRIYAKVDWEGDYRTAWHPTLGLDVPVQAWLPVPLDVSALIATIAAEAGQQVRRPRHRHRPQVDWIRYDACTRRGCWAAAGEPCVDVRSRWSARIRNAARPHPGRPHRPGVPACT